MTLSTDKDYTHLQLAAYLANPEAWEENLANELKNEVFTSPSLVDLIDIDTEINGKTLARELYTTQKGNVLLTKILAYSPRLLEKLDSTQSVELAIRKCATPEGLTLLLDYPFLLEKYFKKNFYRIKKENTNISATLLGALCASTLGREVLVKYPKFAEMLLPYDLNLDLNIFDEQTQSTMQLKEFLKRRAPEFFKSFLLHKFDLVHHSAAINDAVFKSKGPMPVLLYNLWIELQKIYSDNVPEHAHHIHELLLKKNDIQEQPQDLGSSMGVLYQLINHYSGPPENFSKVITHAFIEKFPTYGWLRPLFPDILKHKIPEYIQAKIWEQVQHSKDNEDTKIAVDLIVKKLVPLFEKHGRKVLPNNLVEMILNNIPRVYHQEKRLEDASIKTVSDTLGGLISPVQRPRRRNSQECLPPISSLLEIGRKRNSATFFDSPEAKKCKSAEENGTYDNEDNISYYINILNNLSGKKIDDNHENPTPSGLGFNG